MLFLALMAWFPSYAVWSVAILCAAMFVVGWLSMDINIGTKTTIQLFVDSSYLGKVLGKSTSISYILIPLSLIIAGGMSEIWPSFVLPMSNGILLVIILILLLRGGVHYLTLLGLVTPIKWRFSGLCNFHQASSNGVVFVAKGV